MSLAVEVQTGVAGSDYLSVRIAPEVIEGHETRRSATASVRLHIRRRDQLRILRTLNKALESKDIETKGHSRRVVRYVTRMARAMGMRAEDITDLRLAAAFHDIGKISVPDHIIRKPSELDAEEVARMQEHASIGAWMLSDIGSPAVVEAVRSHHERWDGLGYPNRLSGDRIPELARIIAVADTYDAITSTRPYREQGASDHALNVLKEEAGKQFDPFCVQAFIASHVRRRALPSFLATQPVSAPLAEGTG